MVSRDTLRDQLHNIIILMTFLLFNLLITIFIHNYFVHYGLQEYGQNIMTSPAENDEYAIEVTPILLAAENNNYHIVKVNVR